MASRITAVAPRSRRRFLLAAGAGAAAVAMPQISRAQTLNWRFQSVWRGKDLFHEFAVDYAKRVEEMAGARLKLEVLAAGSVVPAIQMADAVHAGILDGGHGLAAAWQNKHKAYALFGTPPSLGWDSHGFLAWFYQGGGEALYKELVSGILKLDLVGFLCVPMPTQPLGWFNREINSGGDLRGVKFRTTGLAGDLFKELGAAVVVLPGGDIMPAMERRLVDAAEFNNPSSDLQLGLPEVAKLYMMGSHHRPAETFEIIFNKAKYEALPAELRAILRHAALSASSDQLWQAYSRYARDFEQIRKRGVRVAKTGPAVLADELKAWDAVLAPLSKEPFFAKVLASQKAWVKSTGAYLHTNNLDSNALLSAYKHFFG